MFYDTLKNFIDETFLPSRSILCAKFVMIFRTSIKITSRLFLGAYFGLQISSLCWRDFLHLKGQLRRELLSSIRKSFCLIVEVLFLMFYEKWIGFSKEDFRFQLRNVMWWYWMRNLPEKTWVASLKISSSMRKRFSRLSEEDNLIFYYWKTFCIV